MWPEVGGQARARREEVELLLMDESDQRAQAAESSALDIVSRSDIHWFNLFVMIHFRKCRLIDK